MTVANATDKAAEKVSEKLAEKRRALGRGLESLLPGPRAVVAAPTLPQSARKDGAPDDSSSQFSVLSSQSVPDAQDSGRRAGTPVASLEAVPGILEKLQA